MRRTLLCIGILAALGLAGCHDGYYSGGYHYRSSAYLGSYGCDDGYGYGHGYGWWPSWSFGVSYIDFGGHGGHGGGHGGHGGHGGGHGGHGGGHRR
jgi:hypothetical protein